MDKSQSSPEPTQAWLWPQPNSSSPKALTSTSPAAAKTNSTMQSAKSVAMSPLKGWASPPTSPRLHCFWPVTTPASLPASTYPSTADWPKSDRNVTWSMRHPGWEATWRTLMDVTGMGAGAGTSTEEVYQAVLKDLLERAHRTRSMQLWDDPPVPP